MDRVTTSEEKILRALEIRAQSWYDLKRLTRFDDDRLGCTLLRLFKRRCISVQGFCEERVYQAAKVR